MLRISSLAVALTAAAGLAGGAKAADTASMFDVAFGGTVTSDYMSRGISQTNGGMAVQGYAELDYNIFYAEAWASNVNFDGDGDTEMDFSVGFRPEVDPFSFDFGYVQYVYANNISPTYGEVYALVDWAATDKLTLSANTYIAPDYSALGGPAGYGEVKAEYDLPANFSLSGAVGYQAFDGSLDLPDYFTWNAGISWKWMDTLTFDLRYWDTDLSTGECATLMSANACGARIVASVSLDTSLSALRGGH